MMENSKDITEILVRIEMCKLCIHVLEEDCKDDPRQPDALAHYKAQLEGLQKKLIPTKLEDIVPSPQPPDIVINLKPARLFGTVPKLGE